MDRGWQCSKCEGLGVERSDVLLLGGAHELSKILAVLADWRGSESIADHYVRRFRNLIPQGVEIWEISSDGKSGRLVFTGS